VVEQGTHKPLVASSNLALGTIDHPMRWSFCLCLICAFPAGSRPDDHLPQPWLGQAEMFRNWGGLPRYDKRKPATGGFLIHRMLHLFRVLNRSHHCANSLQTLLNVHHPKSARRIAPNNARMSTNPNVSPDARKYGIFCTIAPSRTRVKTDCQPGASQDQMSNNKTTKIKSPESLESPSPKAYRIMEKGSLVIRVLRML
jgi:hypothetical protein